MSNEKPKILLAEDDQFICRAYKDGLSQAGFEVIVASNGGEAVEKIKSEKPDLLLLDLIMPLKSGFEVMEEIKQNKISDLPIMVLSNLSQESDIKKSEELGAVDYIVKSNATMRDVIEKIKDILNK